ncbi:hypothetical protein K443DRAFT_193530, partial [Laccaria amethystina LaAM-08-1]
ESFDLKNRQCCLCSSAVNWGPRILSTSKYPLFKPSLRSLIERVFIRSDRCLQSGSFSYCRLDIPTRPPAAARDGNENPRPPSSTSIRYRENGKLLSFKGEELSYWLSNASVLIFVTLFMSLVLLVPTRRAILSKPPVSSGTIIKILKLRRSLDAYIANRLTIKAFRRQTFLLCLPSANPDPATHSKPLYIRIDEETPLF